MPTIKEAAQLVARVKALEREIEEIAKYRPNTKSTTCLCSCNVTFHQVGGKRPCYNWIPREESQTSLRCECKKFRRDWAYDEKVLRKILERESKKGTESKRQEEAAGCGI